MMSKVRGLRKDRKVDQEYYCDDTEYMEAKNRNKAVFCSQLAAKIYEDFKVTGFDAGHAGAFFC